MNHVAKLVIIDNTNHYLLMQRGDHPTFGRDPDLPGGTLEAGEQPIDTMIREVYEEASIVVNRSQVRQLYRGTDYSHHGTEYSLFVATLAMRPPVTMSWEHSAYEWLDRDEFLQKAKTANDTYMHMVHDVIEKMS